VSTRSTNRRFVPAGPRVNQGVGIMAKFILILCMLVAMSEGSYASEVDKSRVVKVKQDFAALNAALGQYKRIHGKYPDPEEGLNALTYPRPQANLDEDELRGIIRNVPLDPWGNPYRYRNPGVHQEQPEIWSLGADGEIGGTGVNTDFGSWSGSFDAYDAAERSRARIQIATLLAIALVVFAFWFTLPLVVIAKLRRWHSLNLDKKGFGIVVLYVLICTPFALVATVLVMAPISPGVY